MKRIFRNLNLESIKLAGLLVFVCAIAGCNDSQRIGGHKHSGLVGQAERIVQQGLSDDNPAIRTIAIEVIADTKRVELMPKVQQLLKDDFVRVRFLSALAIGDTKYHPAKSTLEQLLKDTDENVRIAAAYALNKLGYSKSFGLLGKAITSQDQTVRANAVLLLGKSGDKSVIKLLYWALRDQNSDDKVRYQSVEAIARLGDEQITPKLWAMLISVYADVRVMGVQAAGALGTTKARDILLTKLDDEIPEVRLVAAKQLGMLGDNAGEARVLEVFQKNLTAGLDKQEQDRVNILAALAIGRIGTADLTENLPQLLKNRSKPVRIAAAKAVFLLEMGR